MKIRTITAVAAVAVAGTTAAAASEVYMGSVALQTTNWSDAISIPGFDSMGGNRQLTEVIVMLTGDVTGTAAAESQDNDAATIDLNLQATLQLELTATGTLLSEVIPVANESFMASAFDGVIDFGGTSGVSFNDLSGMAMETDSITDAMTLANFVDVMSVDLTANATGTSSGSGAGNLLTQFTAQAGLGWKVEYVYQVIPAPSAAAAFGMLGLAATRRRRA